MTNRYMTNRSWRSTKSFDPNLYWFLSFAQTVLYPLISALPGTPLEPYLTGMAKREVRTALKKIEFALAQLQNLLDTLRRLAEGTKVLNQPVSIISGSMSLEFRQALEAERIWREMGDLTKEVYEAATKITSYYFAPGAPIESQAMELARSLRRATRFGDTHQGPPSTFEQAIDEVRAVATRLDEYRIEAWKALKLD